MARAKARNVLVGLMVGVPALLVSAGSTLNSSANLSPSESVRAELGSAQASVQDVGNKIMQDPRREVWNSYGEDQNLGSELRSPKQAQDTIRQVIGGDVTSVVRQWDVHVRAGDVVEEASVLAADMSAVGPSSLVRLFEGRLPSGNDEVMVSRRIAQGVAGIGQTLTVGTNEHMRVVGIGQIGSMGQSPGQRAIVRTSAPQVNSHDEISYLVDREAPVTWKEVKALNEHGFVALSRHVVDNPPPADQLYDAEDLGYGGMDHAVAAVLVVAAVAVMIQVVLLAGPAFAVGVRRQRRELALLAAVGATPKQVRQIVVGQAVVIGLVAATFAGVLGIGVARAVIWLGNGRLFSANFASFDIAWTELLVVVALGTVAAGIASYVPARQASRQDVAAVLGDRPVQPGMRRGWPVVGVAVVALAMVASIDAGREQGGEGTVAVAMVAAVIGAVMALPAIVGLVGRLATWAPLPLRIALRDASRHRARSVPAIAAIMAGVAAVTTLAIASTSDFAEARGEHAFYGPVDQLKVNAQPQLLDDVIEAARKETGGEPFHKLGVGGVGYFGEEPHYVSLDRPSRVRSMEPDVVVAEPAQLAPWSVSLDDRSRDALNDGLAIAADPGMIVDGKVTVTVGREEEDSVRRVQLPAVAGDLTMTTTPDGEPYALAGLVITPQMARTHSIPFEVTSAVAARGFAADAHMVSRVNQAVTSIDDEYGGASVERGFTETFTIQFWLLLVGGIAAVVVGTSTATGLTLSDARADFSTLAAVGASPRTRRWIAGAVASVLAFLGAGMGLVLGFAPGLAAASSLTGTSTWSETPVHTDYVTVPWMLLAALTVIVPLISVAAAMAFTRARLPVVRRLAQ